jgi:hypothetical protein
MILPPFLFICRWIVQFYTIQRQIKRNGRSTILLKLHLVASVRLTRHYIVVVPTRVAGQDFQARKRSLVKDHVVSMHVALQCVLATP